MNWKLVLTLSLFGLAMGIATVYFIPSGVEPLLWLAIFVICAYAVARDGTQRRFLTGLSIGIVNSIWVTGAHVLLFDRYLAGHAREAAMMQSMPLPQSPRLMMVLTGPVIGVISGIVIGALCVIAGKFIGRKPQGVAPPI